MRYAIAIILAIALLSGLSKFVKAEHPIGVTYFCYSEEALNQAVDLYNSGLTKELQKMTATDKEFKCYYSPRLVGPVSSMYLVRNFTRLIDREEGCVIKGMLRSKTIWFFASQAFCTRSLHLSEA